jgi:hypothetical protein
MTSHPISSIFTKLNANKIKTLSEMLTSKQFYEMMPKVMNQDELDFLMAHALNGIITKSFQFCKMRG